MRRARSWQRDEDEYALWATRQLGGKSSVQRRPRPVKRSRIKNRRRPIERPPALPLVVASGAPARAVGGVVGARTSRIGAIANVPYQNGAICSPQCNRLVCKVGLDQPLQRVWAVRRARSCVAEGAVWPPRRQPAPVLDDRGKPAARETMR